MPTARKNAKTSDKKAANADGTPVVKRFRARTEDEARDKRDKDRARWDADLDTSVDVDELTAADLCDRYLGAIERGPETMRRIRGTVALHVPPKKPTKHSIGHIALAKLREDHLLALYDADPGHELPDRALD